MIYGAIIAVALVLVVRWAANGRGEQFSPTTGEPVYQDPGAHVVYMPKHDSVVYLGINTEDPESCLRKRSRGFEGCMSCVGMTVCARGRRMAS